jgi:FMN phosphatase YigB (HAD superfamily)
MPVGWVAFDIGETLVDETRVWGEWADWLGIPRLTFFGALGAVIAERRHHLDVFQLVRPGFDVRAAARARGGAARGGADRWSGLEHDDLYPDALRCLSELRSRGYRLALAGNQIRGALAALGDLGIEADVMASSEGWGVQKPAPEFFVRLIEACGAPAADIAYVGDRIDNDVLPARQAGMVAVFLRRGPWGVIQAAWPEAAHADLRIESLDELPDALSRSRPGAPGER